MTGSRPKVVPLKPGARGGKGRDGASIDGLSGPMLRLLERTRPQLQQLLQTLFDQVDDALFELADRAASNAEQNMYFESMRAVRIGRRGIEQAVLRDLEVSMRGFAAGRVQGGGERADGGANGEALSLLGNDELEEIVAVDSMVAWAEKNYAELLGLINARLGALFPHLDVSLRSNPLGPSCLCRAFSGATRAVELDIRARLVLFKLFDRHVVKALEPLYQSANRQLAEDGVLPQLGRGNQRAGGSGAGHGAIADVAEAEGVFSDLQALLNQVRQPVGAVGGRTGLLAPGLAPALPRDMLMNLLGHIQQQQIDWLARQQAALVRGVVPQQFDVLQALNQLLQQQMPERAVSIGQVDDDAINLVSMLFQFILEDRNLAAPIKGLIARLQIPILKVAMADRSFFGRGGHPARKLLNEIANASLGWSPVVEPERDPFYRYVEQLVERLVDDFVEDVAVFQRELEDFLAFAELDRRRASLIEQRTVDAESGRARSEVARAEVDALLQARIGARELPAPVARLLNEGWSNVLFLISLKEGQQGESWDDALRTVDQLLESIEPVTGPEQRARLMRSLPVLLKNLRSGLNKIGFNPFELNQLFVDLEKIHLQRLRKELVAELRPEPATTTLDDLLSARARPEERKAEPPMLMDAVEAVAPAPAPASVTAAVVAEAEAPVDTFETDALDALGTLDSLDRELAASLGEQEMSFDEESSPGASVADPVLERIDQLQVGGWVELAQAGGMVRCRLAAIIRATGKYIFVNRAGVKVAENTREGLAQAYRRAELIVLDEGRLFDRALESVIGNLREMRNRGS